MAERESDQEVLVTGGEVRLTFVSQTNGSPGDTAGKPAADSPGGFSDKAENTESVILLNGKPVTAAGISGRTRFSGELTTPVVRHGLRVLGGVVFDGTGLIVNTSPDGVMKNAAGVLYSIGTGLLIWETVALTVSAVNFVKSANAETKRRNAARRARREQRRANRNA